MSNDKRLQFEGATVLDQDFLDASHDNLVCKLEMVLDIENPAGGVIKASDRNKYVGGNFYQALVNFPIITRTIGEFLSPTIEFSSLEISPLSNVDGRFNYILPGGGSYNGWVGKKVTVKLGLGETSSTYTTIFEGAITEQAGFKRNVSGINLTARDKFDSINKPFPTQVLTLNNYPNLEEDKINTYVPVIYGDWTVNTDPIMASVPAIPVNGADSTVNGDTSHATNLQLVIAVHALTFFDTAEVYLRRGDNVMKFAAGDITNVSIGGPGVSSFQIIQGSILTAITPNASEDESVTTGFGYARGDEIYVKVKGKDLGAHDDNPVWQARDILITYGGMVSGDFAANWATYRDKNSPTESAISTFKARIWIQEPESALEYALSLLEQVRLEAFIDRSLKLKLFALHFEDFNATPGFILKNADVEKGSFSLSIDERVNFNRVKGVYNFLPNRNENLKETKVYRNNLAIGQAGKEISKVIVFPNLYTESVVIDQVKETLKLTSSYLENVHLSATWRSMLLDIGDFVTLNVQIQSTVFEGVPAVIREIGYDPSGLKIPMRLWSFQMVPFGSYAPGYNGTVGGATATITEE